ncbi:hypothetical protein P378_01835 [Desulforamulus profundi]|uniref:Uncharacterized protein n=1 Tax=Desulforamulus profundi TaxID=1383067 RepID=A0A2C6MIS1_9FIRM|nr:hypothetical protein P378_01835 [Desulforamulus profundi]
MKIAVIADTHIENDTGNWRNFEAYLEKSI